MVRFTNSLLSLVSLGNKPSGRVVIAFEDKSLRRHQLFSQDKKRYVNESDPRSDVHYLGSSENKAWKKIQACTGFEPMTSAIPVQRSTNWANKLGFDVGSK